MQSLESVLEPDSLPMNNLELMLLRKCLLFFFFVITPFPGTLPEYTFKKYITIT